MARAKDRGGDRGVIYVEKPKADVWLALIMVSFLLTTLATTIMYFELQNLK